MSGSNSKAGSVSEYSETAFRSDSIPTQKSLENPGRFAKFLEGGDLIERLGWANYADLDIHVRPLRRRYSSWQMAVAEVHSTLKVELYTHRDTLNLRWWEKEGYPAHMEKFATSRGIHWKTKCSTACRI